MQGNKQTVLIVEDHDDIREELGELVRDHGYDVLGAANGVQALKTLRENQHVAAIILDVEMPLMNGATFRGQQLEDPAIASIPMILLTGRSDAAALASTMGSVVMLQKPYSGEVVLKALDELVRAKR